MGNKWRKLRYNLEEMKRNSIDSLITMGGAYSNHIVATAAAAKELNLKAIGIIRGEELNEVSNPTLQFAHNKGMELHFVDRTKYRNLRNNPEQIKKFYPNHFFLPEGGTNELAVKGCEEIIPEISVPFDMIVTPIGTGGTFAGLTKSVRNNQEVMGISSLKGDFIFNEISELLKELNIRNKKYSIINDYHFGGYGKVNGELIDYINWFKENFDIPLDPIYTGKSFFGVWDMIKTDKFEKNLKIVLLHTGGLQGIKGFNRKNENIIQ